MLVDDSTVVIDNILKNWKLPENKEKDLLGIIKFSVQEV
jgi:multidrug efflux pump subunit AcrB